jgi:hypothetical protein
MEGWRQKGAQE